MNRVEQRRICMFTQLGRISVPDVERVMSTLVELRSKGELNDVILFLCHPKTVAVGMRDRRTSHPKDLLVSSDKLELEGIALTRSVRGGGITYHWPGQVLCYPIVKLGLKERDIPGYMNKLEETAIRALHRFGIEAYRRRDTPAHVGLWTNGRKIVSMGVRISNWITSFGFAINRAGDIGPSRYVRPCGIEGARLTTMEEILGTPPEREEVITVLKKEFGNVFGRELEPMSDGLLKEIQSLVRPSDPMAKALG
jgi:lipoate-protein ligase B